jgi:hypothetical protein
MTAIITVTNNYFADQAAFIAAAGLPKNTKFKKTDLYAEIETWNSVQSMSVVENLPTNVVEITEDNSFDDLFVNWEQQQQTKSQPKAKKEKVANEWSDEDNSIAKNLKLETDRQHKAKLIHDLVIKYGIADTVVRSELSQKSIRRAFHAWNIYSNSERLRDLHIQNIISWSIINDKIAIKPSQFDENNLDALIT